MILLQKSDQLLQFEDALNEHFTKPVLNLPVAFLVGFAVTRLAEMSKKFNLRCLTFCQWHLRSHMSSGKCVCDLQ